MTQPPNIQPLQDLSATVWAGPGPAGTAMRSAVWSGTAPGQRHLHLPPLLHAAFAEAFPAALWMSGPRCWQMHARDVAALERWIARLEDTNLFAMAEARREAPATPRQILACLEAAQEKALEAARRARQTYDAVATFHDEMDGWAADLDAPHRSRVHSAAWRPFVADLQASKPAVEACFDALISLDIHLWENVRIVSKILEITRARHEAQEKAA